MTPYTVLLSTDDSMPLPKVKIANYMREATHNFSVGKLCFFAPEVLQDVRLGKIHRHEKADVWSLGMICYFIATGDHPFKTNSLERIIAREPINFTNITFKDLRRILRKMLSYDEKERIGYKELLRDNFVRVSDELVGNIHTELYPGEYESVKVIGKGMYGKVYEAKRKGEESVAIKEIRASNENQVLRECRIMKMCRHENLVKIIDYFSFPYSIFGEEAGGTFQYIVMERCECDLMTYCLSHQLSYAMVKEIIRQLINGLHYLLSVEKIFHRDLKLENFLIKEEKGKFVVKISDYGFSKVLLDQSLFESYVGTPQYMAPEIAFVDFRGNYTIASDMYSLGVCLHFLACGKMPATQSQDSLWICIDSNIRSDGKYLEGVNPELATLIRKMLQIDVKNRITWTELFQNDYVKRVLGCVFEDHSQSFVKSHLPAPMCVEGAEKKSFRSPRKGGMKELTIEEDDCDDFDLIVQCFKAEDEIIDDEWIEALNSCKMRNVVIQNIKINEVCLASFLEFMRGTITEPIEMPESIRFENCLVPLRLKKEMDYVSTHFNIFFDSLSTTYYTETNK
ncbi:myosin light chain kinase, putative [Entamoeba invadens IP1]|uniref:Myosin light chain kinase, putative n=1 Tax=Entamoeba invadens IP1 TaxID=370355 RepID=A0A0A1U3Z8_ENTIV|nr:myosin light chain kinase, putative [Entamoeba invadens IP1]ELP88886.1 myosin light chain kinase, putative [Entamoeba invadens IP1]|eukprot:XP_004255657.1 myosin light chain kinase, putative [Entamoeba invadens IP1]